MAKQLLQETERETGEVLSVPQEKKYLRLVGGKVIYITEAEVIEEEVLAAPHRELSEQEILVSEWNYRAERVEQLKERISFVHQMMRDDKRRPSQYEPDYNTLWDQYRDAIESLREIDSEAVNQFKDKVVTRVNELEVRLNAFCLLSDAGVWNPDDLEGFEQVLPCYEENYDLMMVL